ncbi:MAG: HAMP domain-containing histidine kinase [Candidatus Aminicenantes bacterium]|nr:MAG: HAMP domain-containing histidine kinase [Candidatus Aminicenantes bacterium]
MTSLRFWRRPSRYSAVLFLGVAAVSVFALVWMGWRLLQQDRALETRRLEEQREAAADRIIAALEKALSVEDRKMADAPMESIIPEAEDYLKIIIENGEFQALPVDALLYYPVITPGQEAPSHQFAVAEKAEFQDKDYSRAIHILRPYSKDDDPAVRVGALMRMARNLKKAGRQEAALNIYQDLSKPSFKEISISGVPVDLVARRALCVLLEELDNQEMLRLEARQLQEDLKAGHWHLDRSSYIYYYDQAAHWLNQEQESDNVQMALAETVLWLWLNKNSLGESEQDTSGRRTFRFYGTSVAVIWRVSNNRLTAVVAGPDYQQNQWFDPLGDSAFSGVRVSFIDSDGVLICGDEPTGETPITTRFATVTGLPWDILVVNASLEAGLNQFVQRRRLMMMGLGVLALLVIAASYLIGRAVSRELTAARLQSDFVSAVSHEFRTPLTSMRQFTEMLVEDDTLPAEKRLTYYRVQERATRRLSRLVESLLDFGRMEAGARPYRLERLDTGELVKNVVEEFKQETNSSSLKLDCSIPEDSPVVNGDQEALAQALWNLLDNAMKYSGDSPVVHVEVESGNQVAIHVRDEGIGIPASEKNRIFRKFVRGSSSKAYGVKGTGIGLAMVKHIVDAHGGKALIESEPGKGSTFTILLPVGG